MFVHRRSTYNTVVVVSPFLINTNHNKTWIRIRAQENRDRPHEVTENEIIFHETIFMLDDCVPVAIRW